MVPIGEIIPHEKNRNVHSGEQIERLAQIIAVSGFRQPLVVSNRSGKLISGHGRLMAAKKLGMLELPVIREDFASDEEEYQHLTADNGIAAWSELDFAGINADLGDLGPDFDIDILGLKDFTIEVADKGNLPEKPAPKQKECPACGHTWGGE